jgi:hypothetical protein
MKLLKRGLSLALAALLSLSLCAGAFAANDPVVALSTQELEVNGEAVPVQAYNIDGANYFKLRDVACLLEGTKAKFNVGYDEKEDAVLITTSIAYEKIGGELTAGEDLSATAVKSKQTIYIDGKKKSLTAYNIGDANYFKLRDLGAALKFEVGYDEERRTVLVTSEAWAPDISFNSTDVKNKVWTDVCFADGKLTILNLWSYYTEYDVYAQLLNLQRISEGYAAKGVQVIGLIRHEDWKKNTELIKKFEITYPNLHYTEDFDRYMGTNVIPKSVLIDENGKVVDIVTGNLGYDEWVKFVLKYLP